jgi:hypothetical protein
MIAKIIPSEIYFLVPENLSGLVLTSIDFWVVTPFSLWRTLCFGAIYILHIQDLKSKHRKKLVDESASSAHFICVLFVVVFFLAYSLILKMEVI